MTGTHPEEQDTETSTIRSSTTRFRDLNVGTKTGALLLAMLLIAGINVGLVYHYLQTVQNGNEQVNVAGSQRMLSEKMFATAYTLANGHDANQNLVEAKNTYAANLNALRSGGTPGTLNRQIQPVPSEAGPELHAAEEFWTEYEANLDTLIQNDPYSQDFADAQQYVIQNNEKLLKQSNDVVKAYVSHPNSGSYSDEINIAGRQRMLSQKISKQVSTISTQSLKQGTSAADLVALQKSNELKAERATLRADIAEYEAALNALENGGRHNGVLLQPAPTSVKDEISSVRDTWEPFRTNADTVAMTPRLNTDFWNALAFLEQNGDRAIQVNSALAEAITAISRNRISQLQNILLGLLVVDIVVFSGGFLLARRTIGAPIQYVTTEAERIADRDLTSIDIDGHDRQDEIGQLATTFRTMVSSLRDTATNLRDNADTVASSAQQLAASNEQTSAATEEISSMVQDINNQAQQQADQAHDAADQLNELAKLSEQISTHSTATADIAQDARKKAETGGQAAADAVENLEKIDEVVNDSAHVVKELGQKSREIGDIVNLITEIAEQTNLLALNAAIEAARAGEQGKGFAVVAEEIRKLAEEASTSAEQISDLIRSIQQESERAVDSMERGTDEVSSGVQVVNQALNALEDITDSVRDTAEGIEEISDASQNQALRVERTAATIDEISTIAGQTAEHTEDVSAATQQQTASMEQVSAASQELSVIAGELQDIVQEFKLEGDDER